MTLSVRKTAQLGTITEDRHQMAKAKSVGLSVEVYVPHEALQGEQVPGFALWSGQVFQKIEIEIPSSLTLAELYNVSEGNWKQEGNRVIVAGLEVNGYLGMLL